LTLESRGLWLEMVLGQFLLLNLQMVELFLALQRI
jgi:hypothetical protein